MAKESIEDKVFRMYAEMMIQKMEAIAANWKQPWINTVSCGMPQNLSGRIYSGVNSIMLSLQQEKENYRTPVYMTYFQAKEEGVYVRKGEKSFPICYWNFTITDQNNEKITVEKYNLLSEEEKAQYKVIPFLNTYNVFNVEQTSFPELQPDKWNEIQEKFRVGKLNDEHNMFKSIEMDYLINNQAWICPIQLKESNKAFYSLKNDNITVPLKTQFSSGEAFYTTLLHEMAHSTGKPERLNRPHGTQYGDKEYAREEIIAELTAAFTANLIGIATSIQEENVTYINDWVTEIKENPKFIMKIIGEASKSSSMITSILLGEDIKNAIINSSVKNIGEYVKKEEAVKPKKNPETISIKGIVSPSIALETKKLHMAYLGNGISLWEEGDLNYTGHISSDRVVSFKKGKIFEQENINKIKELSEKGNMIIGNEYNHLALEPLNKPSLYHVNPLTKETYNLSIEAFEDKVYVCYGKQIFKGTPEDYIPLQKTHIQPNNDLRISDISIFKMKDDKSYCIRAKIDGIQMSGKKIGQSDINFFFDGIKGLEKEEIDIRKAKLAIVYYSKELENKQEYKSGIKR